MAKMPSNKERIVLRAVVVFGLLVIYGHLDSAKAAETEGSRFVSEYIRGLSAVEELRFQAAQEKGATVSQKMASCVRDMTRIDLEFGPSISRIQQFHLSGQLQAYPL